MDSESQCSELESIQENDLTTIKTNASDGRNTDEGDTSNTCKVNGSRPNEVIHDTGTGQNADTNTLPHDNHVVESVGIRQVGNSSPLLVKTPAGSPTTKGFGLKKWRRIRRDVVKETSDVDSSKVVLKRGLSVSGNPANKSTNSMSVEFNQDNPGSVGSINILRNLGVADGFVGPGSSMDPRFTVGHAFAAGIDSENSEDRSSKSSTAASAPRMRYDLPALAMDRNKAKSLGGKNVVTSPQRAQQGKEPVESSKKPRGERVKIEKENSHSSMESDSRSTNFVFMQGAYSVTSNGKQTGGSMNYDGENSDDAHADSQHFREEVQTRYDQENVEEVDDLSQDEVAAEASWNEKGEKRENNRFSSDQDPLVESILTLQSVQRALESEVQKLGEIGKLGSVPADSDFLDPEIHEIRFSEQFHSENVTQSSSLESQVLVLTENVKNLESCLGEAKAMLMAKEARVAELEATLGTLPMEGSAVAIQLLQGEFREIETDFEGLFKEKIEAEIQYLTLARTVEKLRVAAGDQLTLIKQQKALADEQVQVLGKLRESENKVAKLKEQRPEELEKHLEDIQGTEERLKIKMRVRKTGICFSVQLFLFLFALFWLSRLSPHYVVLAPT